MSKIAASRRALERIVTWRAACSKWARRGNWDGRWETRSWWNGDEQAARVEFGCDRG